MAVIYNATLKTARMQEVLDAIDSGTAGFLEIYDAAYANLLVSIELTFPCGTVVADALVFDVAVPPTGVAVATGTAAIARITDSASVSVVEDLSVGVGSGNVQLDSLSITTLDPVTLTAGSIVHG
jgi:hypothetical protein